MAGRMRQGIAGQAETESEPHVACFVVWEGSRRLFLVGKPPVAFRLVLTAGERRRKAVLHHAAGPPGRERRGERSRSQLLFKLGGTENMRILAVNILAVKFWLLIFGC